MSRSSPKKRHFVNGHSLHPPFPARMEHVLFGMGCYWGAERLFWQTTGVYSTAVGFAAGHHPDPNYDLVSMGDTGHSEVVQVVYDPNKTSFPQLLVAFWQGHDPTQGMRQGNDGGSQYRSGIYTFSPIQMETAQASLLHYQQQLYMAGYADITTELIANPTFHYAEDHHQQYLAKNPEGYCGLCGTGVPFARRKPPIVKNSSPPLHPL